MGVQLEFWPQVKRTDTCWLWMGRRGHRDYGMYRHHMVSYRAHRWSWMLEHGPIPPGLLVCHKCDNPPCVRPDHLFLGTPLDNIRDMESKGRARRTTPPRNPPRKLTADLKLRVFELRELGLTQKVIGEQVGLHQSFVSKILRGVH